MTIFLRKGRQIGSPEGEKMPTYDDHSSFKGFYAWEVGRFYE